MFFSFLFFICPLAYSPIQFYHQMLNDCFDMFLLCWNVSFLVCLFFMEEKFEHISSNSDILNDPKNKTTRVQCAPHYAIHFTKSSVERHKTRLLTHCQSLLFIYHNIYTFTLSQNWKYDVSVVSSQFKYVPFLYVFHCDGTIGSGNTE